MSNPDPCYDEPWPDDIDRQKIELDEQYWEEQEKLTKESQKSGFEIKAGFFPASLNSAWKQGNWEYILGWIRGASIFCYDMDAEDDLNLLYAIAFDRRFT